MCKKIKSLVIVGKGILVWSCFQIHVELHICFYKNCLVDTYLKNIVGITSLINKTTNSPFLQFAHAVLTSDEFHLHLQHQPCQFCCQEQAQVHWPLVRLSVNSEILTKNSTYRSISLSPSSIKLTFHQYFLSLLLYFTKSVADDNK